MEPVRKRPGMYIGGTDERALHHLVAEVLDNAMDEAVAGHANRIEVELHTDGSCTVRDNGRGIPIDPHPKFPDKSALEVILCTLHAGGKFSGDAYETSGGLHGVGVSVVNALSDTLRVEVARDRTLWAQEFARGIPQGGAEKIGPAPNRRGTTVTFHPDAEIFGSLALKPARLLQDGALQGLPVLGRRNPLEIGKSTMATPQPRPASAFPAGYRDYLTETLGEAVTYADNPFAGTVEFREKFDAPGFVEWADQLDPVARRLHPVAIATPSPPPKAARMRPASGPPS